MNWIEWSIHRSEVARLFTVTLRSWDTYRVRGNVKKQLTVYSAMLYTTYMQSQTVFNTSGSGKSVVLFKSSLSESLRVLFVFDVLACRLVLGPIS